MLSLFDVISGYTGSCDVCERDWIAAQFRCVDCDIDICRFCIHSHRLETHVDPPKIIRIESGSNNNSIKSCPDHADESCQLFCGTCKRAICAICSCGSHKYHKIVPISVELEKTTKYLQTELDKLLSERRSALCLGEEIQKLKQDVVDCSKQTTACLNEAGAEACKFIIEGTKALETMITSRSKEQAEQIEDVLGNYKSYLQQIEKGVSFLQDLQTSDVCLEVVDAYKKFYQQLNSAKKKFTSNHVTLQVYDFTPYSTTKVFSVNLLDKHFYHLGKLGTFSENKYCITFNPKSLTSQKHPQGFVSLIKRRSSRIIVRTVLIFILFQIILYIGTATGTWDWLVVMVNTYYAQILLLLE